MTLYDIMLHILYSRETLARFLIWRFGEIGKDRQIKNSPIIAKFKFINTYWEPIHQI